MTASEYPPDYLFKSHDSRLNDPNGVWDAQTYYTPSEDFHALESIQLGELLRSGVIVWGEARTTWQYYNIQQYWRVIGKIQDHYFYREIGITPPGQWILEFKRGMNEISPYCNLMYKALDKNHDILDGGTVYGKSRDVDSDFPATQLKSADEDYASSAHDHQHEDRTRLGVMQALEMAKSFEDVDLYMVNYAERFFSSFMTPTVPGVL